MEIKWIKHRKVVAAYYRSANAYAAVCRRQNLSREGMSPVEVQIMEQIIEHSDENRNMKWYANQLGISTSAFTNHVNGLTRRGLVEKFHTTANRKDIILRLTDRGKAAYEEYSAVMQEIFAPMFEEMDKISEDDLEHVVKLLNIWADQQLIGTEKDKEFVLIPAKKKER